MSSREFLESMAIGDVATSHDPADCGHCRRLARGAEIAKEMLKDDPIREDAVVEWANRMNESDRSHEQPKEVEGA